MMEIDVTSRARGAIAGLSVGDALGRPVDGYCHMRFKKNGEGLKVTFPTIH